MFGQEHTYNVGVVDPFLLSGKGVTSPVHLAVHNVDIPSIPRPGPEYLPLPNPRYLELHAACCKSNLGLSCLATWTLALMPFQIFNIIVSAHLTVSSTPGTTTGSSKGKLFDLFRHLPSSGKCLCIHSNRGGADRTLCRANYAFCAARRFGALIGMRWC